MRKTLIPVLLAAFVLSACGGSGNGRNDSIEIVQKEPQTTVCLTAAQFAAYRAKEAQAMTVAGAMPELFGAAYAGFVMHRNEDNSYELRVFTTDLTKAGEALKRGIDRVIPARYSLARLDEAQQMIQVAATELQVWGPILHTVGVRIPKNKVMLEILISREEVGREIADAAKVPYDMVYIVGSVSAPIPASTIAPASASTPAFDTTNCALILNG